MSEYTWGPRYKNQSPIISPKREKEGAPFQHAREKSFSTTGTHREGKFFTSTAVR